MENFKEDILEAAEGEKIIGVVIGTLGWGDYKSDAIPQYQDQPRNQLISWEKAAPLLDYAYDSGYGAPECNAVYVWTEASVIFVSQYDGSTCLHKIPRNPCDCKPEMPGG